MKSLQQSINEAKSLNPEKVLKKIEKIVVWNEKQEGPEAKITSVENLIATFKYGDMRSVSTAKHLKKLEALEDRQDALMKKRNSY